MEGTERIRSLAGSRDVRSTGDGREAAVTWRGCAAPPVELVQYLDQISEPLRPAFSEPLRQPFF
jgi:hypothetical protein